MRQARLVLRALLVLLVPLEPQVLQVQRERQVQLGLLVQRGPQARLELRGPQVRLVQLGLQVQRVRQVLQVQLELQVQRLQVRQE